MWSGSLKESDSETETLAWRHHDPKQMKIASLFLKDQLDNELENKAHRRFF